MREGLISAGHVLCLEGVFLNQTLQIVKLDDVFHLKIFKHIHVLEFVRGVEHPFYVGYLKGILHKGQIHNISSYAPLGGSQSTCVYVGIYLVWSVEIPTVLFL